MSRCIDLAKKGLGTTYPNPLVGCVIVHNDIIIGEGWHYKAGGPHAEVNALANVADPALLPDATLYVNLEPCSHFGKTPPCADLIISRGVKTVVIGSKDPNPKVSGQGIKKLREAGCEVISGVLAEECDTLNKRFFTYHKFKRPYIFLKWAQSDDGYLAPANRSKEKKPVWITNTYSRQLVHRMRAREMAILVGTTTVLEDDPKLTVRDWEGKSPLRIVLDRSLRIPKEAAVLNAEVPTLVITEATKDSQENIDFVKINFDHYLTEQLCELLYNRGIQSLIVEGGSKTLQTFIDENLWDEALVFQGAEKFHDGVLAPKFTAELISEEKIKDDLLNLYKNNHS
ncbi:MAG: bifunctional diaminohydroxyphosphoribosylaminopyrimidine deaminase/5-amino-6-(5-phosphoribosylamino)uracil reductase RibD [Flavobacterium sp.]|nr:MAG: bifunctional diaminohydroxyphosphoribosylaminopyrimidine deaminase/5-amino-6-(5-phosphoribosylamino)uracil reductase RibD [Flavobacterium sp.]